MTRTDKVFWSLWLIVLGLLTLLLALPAGAANWYCRPGTSGAATNWTSATDLSTIWSKAVTNGDTIWVAGGTYSTPVVVTKGGSAGNYIYIKRATAGDAECTGADGWLVGYDAQVVVAPSSYHCLYFNGGSYTYWDGRQDAGIKLKFPEAPDKDTWRVGVMFPNGGDHTYVTLTNIDICGPAPSEGAFYSPVGHTGPAWVQSASHITFGNCRMHDSSDIIGVINDSEYVTFDHCRVYNGVSSSDPAHANWAQVEYVDHLTFRYCEFWNWTVIGLGLGADVGTIFFYGNVVRDPAPNLNGSDCSPSVFEIGGLWGAPYSAYFVGPLYCYNNTFDGVRYVDYGPYYSNARIFSHGSHAACTWHSSSESKNNIVWNSSAGDGFPGESYTYDETDGGNPFNDDAGTNYTLAAGSAAIGAGVVVSNASGHSFDVDKAGISRGATWDAGAYAYLSGATNPVPSYSSYALEWAACGYPGLVETNTITVENIGAGELEVTAALASSAVTNFVLPLTNFIAPAGGTNIPIVCYHGNPGTVTNAVIWYTNGTASATSTLSAVTWALLGESFDAIEGYLTRDYTYTNAGYIFQTWDGRYLGGFDASSRAYYWFHLTNAGNYRLRCEYFSDDGSRNSIWLDIGAAGSGPTNGTYQVWDMPYTNAHNLKNYASWRGSADILTNELAQEFSPMVWSNLQAGVDYLLTVVAREPLCRLFHFDLVRDYYDPPPDETPPQIVEQPLMYVHVAEGSNATFGVVVSGTEPLAYQWDEMVLGNLAWATNASITLTNVQASQNGEIYTCTITNAYGLAQSDHAHIYVSMEPSITAHPATGTNAVGATNLFIVRTAGSSPLAYQWRYNGAAVEGATVQDYALGPLTTNDSGSYDVVVTNAYGAATSQVAVLTVAEPPYIILQPTNRTVYYYSNFQFRVMAGGFAPLRYQWRHNGTNLVDGIWAAWSNLGRGAWPGDAGTYDCVITNIAGAITSSPATLTVLTRWRPSVLRRMQMRD